MRAACVDLTDVAPRRPRAAPLRSPAGPLLVPLDRPALELVWSRGGYPSRGAYRDTHRLTEHRHQAWAVDGAPYEPARGAAQARADAADFVAARAARVAAAVLRRRCDTELLGVHWHEGVLFLEAVLEAADARRPADRAARRRSLGRGRGGPGARAAGHELGHAAHLDTWSAPAAGGLAWRQRARGAARAAAAARRARAARAARAAVLRLGVPRSRSAPRAPTRCERAAGPRGGARGGARGARRPRAGAAQPGAAPGRLPRCTAARFVVRQDLDDSGLRRNRPRCADRSVRVSRMLSRCSATSRVLAAAGGGERGTQKGAAGSRGANRRHERGVAQVIARARQLTP